MRGKLRNLRESYGYSQYAVAEALGISRVHYAQIELGTRNPKLSLAIKIKKFFRYNDDNLFEITSNHEDDVYDPRRRVYHRQKNYNTKGGG